MKLSLTLLSFLFFSQILLSQNAYFFPPGATFDPTIPSPEQFLGYPTGEWHTRHDRIVAYFENLAEVSQKAEFQVIGYTNEQRPQIVLTISDPSNLNKLETIRQEHLKLANPADAPGTLRDMPVIIQLGYGVHGNEASSAEAAMLTAYYLLASQSPETQDFMKNAIILVDPVYNPDGRDRHTWWANMHKGSPPVANSLDREHNEVWPGGRTNHYWFDLNRDWLPLSQVESQNRVAFYHKWLPNVATDYHEMGNNATYFFEPTKPFGSENTLVPRRNYDELNRIFADHFEKAMNDIGSLYYTRESFDNSYPGYGSTYPDMQGGLGLLFEQASSRGHRQQTTTEDITFAFTIRNQVRTGIATVRAAVENREILLNYQRSFFQTALSDARRRKSAGWVFGCPEDAGRNRAFLRLLKQHHIEVFHLKNQVRGLEKTYQPGGHFFVPAVQPQFRLASSIFDPKTNGEIPDSVFYDASAWAVALAFDVKPERLATAPALGAAISESDLMTTPAPVEKASYAYLFEWSDYLAPKALNFLLEKEIHVKTAFKPFTATVGGVKKSFGYGTMLVAVADQKKSADEIFDWMKQASSLAGIEVYSISTGRNPEGIDLGSPNFRTVEQPKVVMLVGEGISGYEAGEVWHLLDSRVGLPITKVDVVDLERLNLYDFNTLLLVSGSYRFDEKTIGKIKDWAAAGNTVITSRMATKWAIDKKLVSEKLRTPPKDTIAPAPRLNFDEASEIIGSKRIGGVVFPADVDITHPLGFGFTGRQLPVYRNHEIFVEPSRNAFSTVVQLSGSPQVDGYVHPDNLPLVKNSASLLVSKMGRGRAILFLDNPNFRGFWYGTNRLFFNALYLGSLVSVPE